MNWNPCARCGVGIIQEGVGFGRHPMNNCSLSGTVIAARDREKWNAKNETEAAPPPGPPGPPTKPGPQVPKP